MGKGMMRDSIKIGEELWLGGSVLNWVLCLDGDCRRLGETD